MTAQRMLLLSATMLALSACATRRAPEVQTYQVVAYDTDDRIPTEGPDLRLITHYPDRVADETLPYELDRIEHHLEALRQAAEVGVGQGADMGTELAAIDVMYEHLQNMRHTPERTVAMMEAELDEMWDEVYEVQRSVHTALAERGVVFGEPEQPAVSQRLERHRGAPAQGPAARRGG